ncbi:LANO_0E06876g1_1 [Lachancea nothofagi CBS 11611]|uniref:LANO_0E06876g1_1 n=1 Tax=Lachancea nothofagi CBS 11611 TaxID=1266666 RepID=A0A1G4JU61_9SACH|nr:LANO_0E06876g1_1 [Lachancea nothofagi CBS 11611]
MAEFESPELTNHRVLVSLKEAARIIGAQGTSIQKIRESNQVKIGISPHERGCSDRILSCTGSSQSVANAIGDVVDVLNQDDGEPEVHSYKPLNFILPVPAATEIQDPESINRIGNLRLIVSNSQVSSIIGTQGSRIKALIEKHGVKVVASKNFLPDSQDRVVEIQGYPGSIASCLVDVSEVLAQEAKPTSEKQYYPHTKSQEEGSVTKEVAIPVEFVGALLGRGGNRVSSLRKYTKTKVIVSDEPNEENNRVFTITGNNQNSVKLAETMLLKNLDTEKQRREEKV